METIHCPVYPLPTRSRFLGMARLTLMRIRGRTARNEKGLGVLDHQEAEGLLSSKKGWMKTNRMRKHLGEMVTPPMAPTAFCRPHL